LDEGTWQQLKAVTTPLLAYGIAVALGVLVGVTGIEPVTSAVTQ
jgi:hypothetical protein